MKRVHQLWVAFLGARAARHERKRHGNHVSERHDREVGQVEVGVHGPERGRVHASTSRRRTSRAVVVPRLVRKGMPQTMRAIHVP